MHQESVEQQIVYGRAGLWAPFYAVGMTARFQGDIPVPRLEAALDKLRIMHPPLATRVRIDEDGVAFMTDDGVGGFPLEVRTRVSDEDWVRVFLEQERVPFAFERGPVARFFLLRGAQSSDIIVIAPHVICDGRSIAHVIFDLVSLLNDPDRPARRPSPSPAVTYRNLPQAARDNLLLRAGAQVINHVWPGDRSVLGHNDYLELHRVFWARQRNDVLVSVLTPAETAALIARGKQHSVSVTSALVAAFRHAQSEVSDCAVAHPRCNRGGEHTRPAVSVTR